MFESDAVICSLATNVVSNGDLHTVAISLISISNLYGPLSTMSIKRLIIRLPDQHCWISTIESIAFRQSEWDKELEPKSFLENAPFQFLFEGLWIDDNRYTRLGQTVDSVNLTSADLLLISVTIELFDGDQNSRKTKHFQTVLSSNRSSCFHLLGFFSKLKNAHQLN